MIAGRYINNFIPVVFVAAAVAVIIILMQHKSTFDFAYCVFTLSLFSIAVLLVCCVKL